MPRLKPFARLLVDAVAVRQRRRGAWLGLGLAAALLAACGGGDSGTTQQAAAAAEGRKQTLAALPPGSTIPPDANTAGMWGPLSTWPLVSVHAVLMPDGRVLSYGSQADGTQTGYFSVDVWDSSGNPDTGHMTFANGSGVDLFCNAQLLLPPTSTTSTPSVFMAGGDNWTGTGTTNTGNNRTTVFSPAGNTISRGADMARARWYASTITLVNGETLVMGGDAGNDRPEVRQADGSFRLLSGADTSNLFYQYPRNFVMPDGRVFGLDGYGAMYFVNTAGTGSFTPAGAIPFQYAGSDGSAAMFRPGRILHVAGNSNSAIVIDVTSGAPVPTPTQSISSQRRLLNLTLLPDGQVLATGGSPYWNNPWEANTAAEVWNPTTGQWTVGARGARPGLYHSNALLLPDATVLVTTGGAPVPDNLPKGDHKAQLYYPAYFFGPGGTLAVRPAITATPDWLEIGKTFTVQASSGNGIGRVTLVKTGAATHGFNMDQRFIELAFTREPGTGNAVTLNVQAPTRAGEATPGYYMLFVLDSAGVPSVARILRLGVASNPNPATVPTLANPGPRSGTAGTPVSLQLAGSDPNGDVLRYSAAGLPPGLAIDRNSGLISGTPTTAGSYSVVAAASDGVNSASVTIPWTVQAGTPLSLTAMPSATLSQSGSSASFSATATGAGVQYQWSFGDGSPDSAWSTSGSISKTYSAPGTYNVTLRVRDAAGALVSRTFLHTVFLPATANRPTASTNLLLETPATGNARLWVVNQDNNSVTAFDAVTRARLGEVAVGAAPRSIARAPNGLLWVTNKLGASISVIDPATRSVTRTIALPRASQPFGVAMSPTAAQAFVVLEATGQLLRFDTGTFAQTGSLAVGTNARHVSVAADGASVFVSRFITPPLPGESTASVQPGTAGGEVLQVAAGGMTLLRTIRLLHSDKPDGENSGSGIPNYLGAATISPDGSQAYVPGKQDNVRRGTLRGGGALNFQNTVRAISARVVLGGTPSGTDDLARRVDHDNASMTSAVAYDTRGVLLFAALETSREVAVVDAHSGIERMRFDVGRAPQGLALSADGLTLFVNNFMDRTVSVHDLRPLLQQSLNQVPLVATLQAVATEALSADVLAGKQLFYDARDPRLARDRYMSCASCHNDGGHDGRTWDFTQAGEGLRNTTSLRGRGGVGNGHGRLHWSANFDEVQDFEAQIRSLAGGTGLMSDAQFNTGTRSQPLGDPKAGVSADLDRLAAYVNSLRSVDPSPARQADGALTAEAVAGRAVFAARCASCHTGSGFNDSDKRVLHTMPTQKASSGQRLFTALNGLDTPTLRDVWATAPYLHDGSAPTLDAAVQAHGLGLSATELANVVAYTRQIGAEEPAAPASTANLVVRALGELLDRVGALFEVRVNGQVVRSGQLDATAWTDLPIDVPALARDNLVEVVFKNDDSNATQDRNMAVQSLRINGSTLLLSTATGVVIDRGSGAFAFDGLDLVNASTTGGWMPWNGAMRWRVPDVGGPTETLVVRGQATLAGGVGAQIELRINGALIETRMLQNTSLADLSFTVPTLRSGDRIDIVFTNDATIGTEDRNLYVQAVVARGSTLLSTAAGVLIDRGSGAAALDGLDVVAAGSTGGWVPWNASIRFVLP